MAKRKKKPASNTSAARARAGWKGNLSFGLVTFPVEAFNALDRSASDIHFNQLHEKCHSRIRYQKVCPVHGPVENDEIVSGYEHRKGKYIEIDPEELTALRTERERALTIDAFVSPETVDPLYFDGRMYYLLPAGSGAEESYAVIMTAMEQEKRYAIGRVVFSGKDQIVLVRPVDGVLHMAMLNFHAEIRPAAKVAAGLKSSVDSRQSKLARTLVREWSDDKFDFSQYEDTYREKVQELIAAKVKGHELVAPEEKDDEPATINLMDALKKSLKQSRPATKRAAKTKSSKRPARSA
jgi:DNA end-binding protein Ku